MSFFPGYMVILPDWYRGKMQDPADGMDKLVAFIKEETKWDVIKADWDGKIRPYAERHGAKIFGSIGTCWGSVPVLRFSADPDTFRAGVSMHPSHTPIFGMLGEDQEAALRAAAGVPQLFMPAGDDPPDVNPGGIGEKVLGDKLSIVQFKEMNHGWTTKGDISDEKVFFFQYR